MGLFMARDPNALIGRRKPEAERVAERAYDNVSRKGAKRAVGTSDEGAMIARSAFMAACGDKPLFAQTRLLFASLVSLCEIPSFFFAPLRLCVRFFCRARGADLP
jgi:hypothetical protein